MSRVKAQFYRKPETTHSLRLPYFADKMREILEYFSLTGEDFYQKTGASQQSVSDWLRGKTCPRTPTLKAIATHLPEPIPQWWLTSGPEGGSLQDVLAKEKTHASEKREDAPRDTPNLLEKFQSVMSAEGDAQVVRWQKPLENLIDIAYDDALKQRAMGSRQVTVKNDTALSSRRGGETAPHNSAEGKGS